MQAISLADLATHIRTHASLQAETLRLRKIKDMDASAYRKLKTRLPYIVGASFVGNQRRSEAFTACHAILLDIDHCMLEEGKVPSIVQQDERVALAFVSPSGEGFKVLCLLQEPCLDLAAYKAFYRAFATQFAESTQVAGSIDLRTCDATRACFLAHDPHVYVNPLALPIDWKHFVTPLFQDDTPVTTPAKPQVKEKKEIDPQKYEAVLKSINPQATIKKANKQVFVPDVLQKMEGDLSMLCKMHNWELVQLQPLNYGIKVMIRQGYRSAEVNVFHGKKGFSLVLSPKTGTDPHLAHALHKALEGLLFTPTCTTEGISLNPVLMQN